MNVEPSIIGTLLEHPDLDGETPFLARMLENSPESFDDLRCGAVAAAIKNLRREGKPVYADAVAESISFEGSTVFISSALSAALTLGIAEIEAATLWLDFVNRQSAKLLAEAGEALIATPEQRQSILEHVRFELDRLDAGGMTDGLPEILDAANFLSEPLPMPPEVIARLLHQSSKLAIGGNSKAFKTWILLALAVAVATGTDWLGFHCTKGKVLFVNFEIQPAPWQRRIAAIARAMSAEIKKGQIAVWNLRGFAADYRTLIPKIIARARAEGFALIVLDPLYKLLGQADENSARDIAGLLNAIERIATHTGAAVAYANHFAKGNASNKEAQDRISGSGVFARDPDSLVIFTEHDNPGSFTVETILRNFPPVEPFVVSWDFPLMRRDDELDPADLKQTAGRKKEHDPAKLLAVIVDRDEQNPISISQWALAGKVKRQTLTDYLPEMRRKGWIKTIGHGTAAKQAITNAGKAFLIGGQHDGN